MLSPLLFITVLDALSKGFREDLHMELLYAVDLVLMAATKALLAEKLLKRGMEEKDLRDEVMKRHYRSGQIEKSGKWPCKICTKSVGSNSIQFTSCNVWIHKRCSGISGQLQGISNFRCRCYVNGEPININVDNEDFEFGLGDRVDLVERFCYLGDMIGAGGGVKAATRARGGVHRRSSENFLQS